MSGWNPNQVLLVHISPSSSTRMRQVSGYGGELAALTPRQSADNYSREHPGNVLKNLSFRRLPHVSDCIESIQSPIFPCQFCSYPPVWGGVLSCGDTPSSPRPQRIFHEVNLGIPQEPMHLWHRPPHWRRMRRWPGAMDDDWGYQYFRKALYGSLPAKFGDIIN